MFIYDLVHELYMKFIPGDQQNMTQLKTDFVTDYAKIRTERDDILEKNKVIERENRERANEENYKPQQTIQLKPKHKVIGFLQQYWMRYLLGALFVIAVPYIKKVINGEIEQEPEDDSRSGSEFDEFLEWKRFKSSQV